MAKEILFNKESHEQLIEGINIMADAVASTLGPKGRNAIIESPYGLPFVSRDGVTVSRHIQLENKFQDMGAQLIRSAAEKTVEQAGDGTTTTCVLARAMCVAGLNAIKNGANPVELKAGIDLAVTDAVELIKKHAIPINGDWSKIEAVSVIAANNDKELGKLVSDTMQKVGESGVVNVIKGSNPETTVEIIEGMQIDRGFISPYFINKDAKPVCELDNPLILIYDKDITDVADIMNNIIGPCFRDKKALLIIAQDVDGAALSLLVVNKNEKGFPVCAVYAPSKAHDRKDIFEDISIMVGGGLCTDDMGRKLKNVSLSDLGSCQKVIVSKDSTIIIGGNGSPEAIEKRITQIKAQLEEAESQQRKDVLQKRLANLTTGIGIIKAGGVTAAEAEERKFRIDDCVGAVKSALSMGVIPGGGNTSLFISEEIKATRHPSESESTMVGRLIVAEALSTPFHQICDNSGYEGPIKKRQVFELNDICVGLNARTGNIGNLIDMGVLDSAMILKCCLENAASVAGLILTSNVSIIEKPEEKSPREYSQNARTGSPEFN